MRFAPRPSTPGVLKRPPAAILKFSTTGAVLAARAGRVVLGTQSDYEVTVYDLTGAVLRRVRWSGPPLALTEAAREEWAQEYLERSTRSEETRRRIVRMVEVAPLPERRPAYGELHLDATGHRWVAEYAPPIPGVHPTRWHVFNPEGRLLGAVEVPDRFQVHEIGEDYVLGVGRDDYDVEYVRVYRLEKGGV